MKKRLFENFSDEQLDTLGLAIDVCIHEFLRIEKCKKLQIEIEKELSIRKKDKL